MGDPAAATITQLKNIQARTGRTIAELHAALASSGLAKHGERRAWLMEHFKLGYGDVRAHRTGARQRGQAVRDGWWRLPGQIEGVKRQIQLPCKPASGLAGSASAISAPPPPRQVMHAALQLQILRQFSQ